MNVKDKIENLFNSSYDKLIFEKRNKLYGAYQLRILSRTGLAIGFVSTLVMFFSGTGIISYWKPAKEIQVKVRNFEVFDPHLKTTPLEIVEPAQGNPEGEKDPKPETKPEPENTAKPVDAAPIDPRKIAEDIEKANKKKQDSLAQAKADSVAAAQRFADSLAAAAKNAKDKFGALNGKGQGIDTTHHKPIGGPTEFGIWLADKLKSKYTPELKEYGRKVTFTVGFNINSDSTISDVKIYQKAYFGMDDIIVKAILDNPKKWSPSMNERGEIIKQQPVKLPVTLLPLIK